MNSAILMPVLSTRKDAGSFKNHCYGSVTFETDRLRILLFSSIAFKKPAKKRVFKTFLFITYPVL
jgi:hypothetical protein